MLSPRRAVEVINQEGDANERGELLEFIRQHTDDLEEWLITDDHVNADILAYIRVEWKYAVAGLGFGRSAGAGECSLQDSLKVCIKGKPAPKRLVDSAAKLRQLADKGIWELQYSDYATPYFDAAGVVDGIRTWAETALMAAVYRGPKASDNAPAPLLISGLVKTGKSETLEHVVPAVVAEALRKRGGGGPLAGMAVLRLRCDVLNRAGGAAVLLNSMLLELVHWAREEHVPVREGALEAAEDALAQPSAKDPSGPADAVLSFIKAVEVPVLALCDEVQRLTWPTIDGRLDSSGADYIRDSFMKQLLVHGPHTVLWCLTGRFMSRPWISLARLMPAAVHLPTTHSAEHMSLAWEELQDQYSDVPLDPRLDPKLLQLCPPSVALLSDMVHHWFGEGCTSDVEAFAGSFIRAHFVYETLREWQMGLQGMPPSQGLTLLGLSCPGVGARIDTRLHPGLRHFLEPHLDKKEDGRHYFFRDSYQRQIVRVLFSKDGTLRGSWDEREFSASLTQLDGGWTLFRLAEAADYLLGPNASCRWEGKEPPARMGAFRAKLQAIADEVADKSASAPGGAALSPRELWEQQPWFQEVLMSEWNGSDRAAYMDNQQARRTHLDMLVFYLRLSRKVLGHAEPWDRETEYCAVLDVGVVEALPRVLGQSLPDFNDAMVGALRLLSRHSAKKAAAAFNAPLSGGGSSVKGLAEDEGRSIGGLSSGTGGIARGGRRGSSGGGGRGRGIRAMADMCAPARPGPAAGCGQRTPLAYAPGRHGVWGQGGPRAATLAPSLHVQRSLVATSAAVGLRLPALTSVRGARLMRLLAAGSVAGFWSRVLA